MKVAHRGRAPYLRCSLSSGEDVDFAPVRKCRTAMPLHATLDGSSKEGGCVTTAVHSMSLAIETLASVPIHALQLFLKKAWAWTR